MRISPDGNIGIGTTAPAALLTLQKDQATGTEIRVANNNTAGFAGLYLNSGFTQASGGLVQWNNNPGNRNLFVTTGGADPLYLGTENSIRLTVQPTSGNVGIGTTGPGYKLDVQGGQINAAGGLCIAGDCKTAWSQVGGSSRSQWITSSPNIYYNTGNVGIGTTSPSQKLAVAGNIALSTGGDVIGDTTNPYLRLNNTSGAHLGYANTAFVLTGGTASLTVNSIRRLYVDGTFGRVAVGPNIPVARLNIQESGGSTVGGLTYGQLHLQSADRHKRLSPVNYVWSP